MSYYLISYKYSNKHNIPAAEFGVFLDHLSLSFCIDNEDGGIGPSITPRPKSGLRTSATAPGELFKEEPTTLPGRVEPGETDLHNSLSAGNLRPASARRGHRGPKDLSDDDISL